MEVLGGKKIKSPGNFMNCRENRYIFLTPIPPRMERGRGGREGGADGREGTGRVLGRNGGREAGIKEGHERNRVSS